MFTVYRPSSHDNITFLTFPNCATLRVVNLIGQSRRLAGTACRANCCFPFLSLRGSCSPVSSEEESSKEPSLLLQSRENRNLIAKHSAGDALTPPLSPVAEREGVLRPSVFIGNLYS